MDNKYWIIILIGLFLLAGILAIVSYKHGVIEGYDKKICVCIDRCPVCVDNYYKGYNDCTEKYKERIDYCFEKCSIIHSLCIDDTISKTCMWNCLHDYNIVKID